MKEQEQMIETSVTVDEAHSLVMKHIEDVITICKAIKRHRAAMDSEAYRNSAQSIRKCLNGEFRARLELLRAFESNDEVEE